ncbi:MAG TPA: Xaa-Pro peptidase family protein [Acidimicrobiales bacterium]|nr:Xaa-Pro peptidase family protein [Acidimicrobiales bacterium]
MGIHTHGTNNVDWESRVDMPRLREERLARLQAELERSELGALLTFDFSNIRYMTGTHIGTWAMDKLIRFALLPRGGKPIVWDFGSAARHHQLYNPWLSGVQVLPDGSEVPYEGARAGLSTLRGAIPPGADRAGDVAAKIKEVLHQYGLQNEPVGVDVIEMPILTAFAKEGISLVDGQQVFLAARRLKTADEIALLTQAASMVDAAYEELYSFLRAGVRENECVAVVNKTLYDLGSEYVEGVNAISGERCSPHPHVYSDRLIRPGDPAFFDILHSFNGYRTCYYRTFAVGSASVAQRDAYTKCRELIDTAIAMVKPGVTTADVVAVWPKAEEFGFASEEAAFGLQYGHGVGLSIWERPIFSRMISFDHPEVLEEGMVFALETYWPAKDGWSAARIEEEVVVTATGCEVITKFPAEELLVAGKRYYSAGGTLSELRESQSNLNTPWGRGE